MQQFRIQKELDYIDGYRQTHFSQCYRLGFASSYRRILVAFEGRRLLSCTPSSVSTGCDSLRGQKRSDLKLRGKGQ